MKLLLALTFLLAAAMAISQAQSPDDSRLWSPDRKLYALNLPGERVGEGEERQRFVIYSDQGKQLAVAHVWLTEPDGTGRAGIRGCESWGWVDSSRLFCASSINPSTSIYLMFDANTGRELIELGGSNFTWSLDRAFIANFGNVPHFSSVESKSDSIEIQGKRVYPDEKDKDRERHWFRSELTWAPDSKSVAVVEQRRDQSFHLVVVRVNGCASEHELRWREPMGDWPPDRDFLLQWSGRLLSVKYGGSEQVVPTTEMRPTRK